MDDSPRSDSWTDEEREYLFAFAGRMPVARLCAELGRDEADVSAEVRRMQDVGIDVSLKVAVCPSCGNRAPLGVTTGFCRACELRRVTANVSAAQAALLSRLPDRERATYADTEAEIGSRVEGRPKPAPMPRGATVGEAYRWREARDAQLAEWEAAQLHRAYKAAQKRRERIRRKVRECEEARCVTAKEAASMLGATEGAVAMLMARGVIPCAERDGATVATVADVRGLTDCRQGAPGGTVPDGCVTTGRAAAMLGINRSTVVRLVDGGGLPSVKCDGSFRAIPVKAVLDRLAGMAA